MANFSKHCFCSDSCSREAPVPDSELAERLRSRDQCVSIERCRSRVTGATPVCLLQRPSQQSGSERPAGGASPAAFSRKWRPKAETFQKSHWRASSARRLRSGMAPSSAYSQRGPRSFAFAFANSLGQTQTKVPQSVDSRSRLHCTSA